MQVSLFSLEAGGVVGRRGGWAAWRTVVVRRVGWGGQTGGMVEKGCGEGG